MEIVMIAVTGASRKLGSLVMDSLQGVGRTSIKTPAQAGYILNERKI